MLLAAADTFDEEIPQLGLNAGMNVQFWLFNQKPRGDNIVAVLYRGKPTFYEVADPLLYRSLSRLNRPGRDWLIRLISLPRRVGQASVTLTADFMAANMFRDTLMGAVMSRHGFNPFIDSVRGLKSRVMADQNYRDFIANGGGFSSYFTDEGAFRTHLERFYTKKGINYRTVLDTPMKLVYALERLADATEMSTRLGEFRQATGRGEHPRHAAYSAREVSTDFAMRGDNPYLEFMYDTVLFLKAGMNGLDRTYRGFTKDPNRAAIAAKTAMLAAASAALYAYNRDNPAYQALEDWDKDTHWHLFVPKLDGGQHHFRLPKIWEVGAIASSAERTLEGVLEGQPAEAANHVRRAFVDLFKMEWVPQAVEPLYEVYGLNRNRFTKRPIETQAMQERQPWARYSAYTSPTMRALGEATRRAAARAANLTQQGRGASEGISQHVGGLRADLGGRRDERHVAGIAARPVPGVAALLPRSSGWDSLGQADAISHRASRCHPRSRGSASHHALPRQDQSPEPCRRDFGHADQPVISEHDQGTGRSSLLQGRAGDRSGGNRPPDASTACP